MQQAAWHSRSDHAPHFAGDQFGYRVCAIGELKHLSVVLISHCHPFDGLRPRGSIRKGAAFAAHYSELVRPITRDGGMGPARHQTNSGRDERFPVCSRLRAGLGCVSARTSLLLVLPPGGGFAFPEMFPSLGISDKHPMAQRKHEPGPPMNLATMRRQVVR